MIKGVVRVFRCVEWEVFIACSYGRLAICSGKGTYVEQLTTEKTYLIIAAFLLTTCRAAFQTQKG